MITTSDRSTAQPGRFDWPWRGGPDFVTPDGSVVRLRGPGLDTSRPWSCAFLASVGGARRVFTVAERGAFDWHSRFTTVPDEVTRHPYRSGDLLVGIRAPRGTEPGDHRAAWQGQWFELHTSAGGPAPAVDELVRLFDAFLITDTPLGMQVAPRTVRRARMDPVSVAKELPGIGRLTIERPGHGRALADQVPPFRGLATRHGELWRQPLAAGGQGRAHPQALLLATPTAVTRLVPGPRDHNDPAVALATAAGLNVIWEAA